VDPSEPEAADLVLFVPKRLEYHLVTDGQKPVFLGNSGRYVGKFPHIIATPPSIVAHSIPLVNDGTNPVSATLTRNRPRLPSLGFLGL
jgi:hypothetical protein